MYAIFTGDFSNGFKLTSIVSSEQLDGFNQQDEFPITIEVTDPSLVQVDYQAVEGGHIFVTIGSCFGHGYSVYGPFNDDEVACNFAEAECGSNEEWKKIDTRTTQNSDNESPESPSP